MSSASDINQNHTPPVTPYVPMTSLAAAGYLHNSYQWPLLADWNVESIVLSWVCLVVVSVVKSVWMLSKIGDNLSVGKTGF